MSKSRYPLKGNPSTFENFTHSRGYISVIDLTSRMEYKVLGKLKPAFHALNHARHTDMDGTSSAKIKQWL
jgi:hypothetical protein